MHNAGEQGAVELMPGGASVEVNASNRKYFARLVETYRYEECSEQCAAVLQGVTAMVPLSALGLLSWSDCSDRACGSPEIDLPFLKQNTQYNSGVKPNDPHVQYFWEALDELSQDDLRRFVRFAVAQERLPSTPTLPFPMKLETANPSSRNSGRDNPDKRHIRAETCMFMVKLPKYSSLEKMREMLSFVIHHKDNPLND
jgi:E3 ubiquitin-protein ligase HECTD4